MPPVYNNLYFPIERGVLVEGSRLSAYGNWHERNLGSSLGSVYLPDYLDNEIGVIFSSQTLGVSPSFVQVNGGATTMANDFWAYTYFRTDHPLEVYGLCFDVSITGATMSMNPEISASIYEAFSGADTGYYPWRPMRRPHTLEPAFFLANLSTTIGAGSKGRIYVAPNPSTAPP
jgi:hypothetical protein